MRAPRYMNASPVLIMFRMSGLFLFWRFIITILVLFLFVCNPTSLLRPSIRRKDHLAHPVMRQPVWCHRHNVSRLFYAVEYPHEMNPLVHFLE